MKNQSSSLIRQLEKILHGQQLDDKELAFIDSWKGVDGSKSNEMMNNALSMDKLETAIDEKNYKKNNNFGNG